jgi:hypothetical protein
MSTVLFHSKASVTGYVQTALASAGAFISSQDKTVRLDEAVFKAARERGSISTTHRPTIINLFNIVDNGNVGWFSTKNITLFNTLFSEAPAAPAPTEKTSKEDEKRKSKESEDRWNKVLGSLITLAAAFFTGFTYDEYSIQEETLSCTTQVINQCVALPTPIHHEFKSLVVEQLAIDRLNYGKAKKYFISSLGALIGGGVWALGGFIHQPHLSTAGKVMCLFAAGFALFTLGKHWRDSQKILQHSYNIAGDGKTRNGWANFILYQALPNYSPEMRCLYKPLSMEQPRSSSSSVNSVDPHYQSIYPALFNTQLPPMPRPSAPAWDA